MNENRLIEIIKEIAGSNYIGDDCAYLDEFGITVTQDSLVEDVHFRLKWMSAEELGVKSVLVSISDIIASGARPYAITIGLSLPKTMDEEFVRDFYKGAQKTCHFWGVKIVGGDLTSADKVYVSTCAIGSTKDRNISSRKDAQVGYSVVLTGDFGSSAAGLRLLESGTEGFENLKKLHKEPMLYPGYSFYAANVVKDKYAMMDTSDGLADALFKIATASGVSISIDFDKIPFLPEIKYFDDYKDLILFGAEDYALVALVPEIYAYGTESAVVGQAIPKEDAPLIVNYPDKIVKYTSLDGFTYNHF